MQIKNIKFILSIIIMAIFLLVPQVYAKTSIEIKPNSSNVYTNKTISEFFKASLAMKDAGEGLDGAGVDVHMATNSDWAIVSYFSNSAYGTSGKGGNDGIQTSIDGRNYMSTNGNATGVMDFGANETYTAALIKTYTEINDSTIYANGEELIKYANSNVNDNNTHIDFYENNNYLKKHIAYTSAIGASPYSPYFARRGLFSGWAGGPWQSTGTAYIDFTFRPAIWN